jgi:hypothetical protein
MTLKPVSPRNSNKAKYQKGYYWEREGITLLLKLYNNTILYYIKSPYAYPFDFVCFTNEKYPVWLVEVRYKYDSNVIILPKAKIRKLREYVSRFRKINFRYVVIAFYQSKYNYVIEDLTECLQKNKYPERIIVPVK